MFLLAKSKPISAVCVYLPLTVHTDPCYQRSEVNEEESMLFQPEPKKKTNGKEEMLMWSEGGNDGGSRLIYLGYNEISECFRL